MPINKKLLRKPFPVPFVLKYFSPLQCFCQRHITAVIILHTRPVSVKINGGQQFHVELIVRQGNRYGGSVVDTGVGIQ